MPIYEHVCEACNEEFEEMYGPNSPIPTLCPNCGVDGKIKRLIPSVTHGRVPLTGHDLKSQIKKDTTAFRSKVSKDENVKANIVGEEKYNNHVVAMDKLKETYKK